MNNPDQVAFGQLGSKYVTNTNTQDLEGKTVVAVTAITAINFHGDTTSDAGFEHPATVPEGVTVFGRINTLRLSSGSALVYFG